MCDEQTSYWNGARDCALSILIELEKVRAPTKSKEAARRAWISAATIGSERFRRRIEEIRPGEPIRAAGPRRMFPQEG